MNNRIRLPFYLSQPQFPVDEEVYLKANGTRRVLRSTVNKEYQGRVDWIPREIHERLAVALRHDIVIVESLKVNASIRINGGYEIEWQDFIDHPVAPAKFKAFHEAFVARNTRCGTCPIVLTLETEDDEIPGNLLEGETYQIDVTLNDVICCADPVFSILTFNAEFIDSISISAVGVVTFTLNAPVNSMADVSLFTYRVTCGEETSDATVKGNIEGSLSAPCDPPLDLIVTSEDNAGNIEIHAEWAEPAGGPPANGYQYVLADAETGTTLALALTSALSADITVGLSPDKEYVFCVRAICDGKLSLLVCQNVTTPVLGGSPIMFIFVEPIFLDAGSVRSWRVRATIVHPPGVTLIGNVTIEGTLRVFGTTFQADAFTLNLVAGTSTVSSAFDVINSDLSSTADIIDHSGNPSPRTGSDAISYVIQTTV